MKTGFVRKLFDAESGQRIKGLKDLRDGQNLVASSGDSFKPARYMTHNPSASQFDIRKEDDVSIKTIFH
jgi:hypothetical protein